MTLAFVQKISGFGTASVSLSLPSGGSTAGTMLACELSQTASTSFTPPSGSWIKGPSVVQGGGNVITEQWYLPNNPGGLATAGTPLVFTGAASQPCRGSLTEWSSAAGTSQTLVTSVTATAAGPVASLPITAVAGGASGGAGLVNWGASYSAAQAGSWTDPGGAWVNDQKFSNSPLIVSAYHQAGLSGSFTSLSGAIGMDPSLGCPTSIAGFTYANSVIGPLTATKLFYTGLPSSIADTSKLQGGGSPNDLPAGVVPVLCYKTPTTNVASFAASVTRPVIMVWLNEAENKSYTYSQFKTTFSQQSALIRGAANPLVQVAMVSIGYQYHTGVNADAVAGRWLANSADTDMYLIDLYQHYDIQSSGQPGGYAWPAAGLSGWDQWLNWVNVAAAKNKPLGIAEYGIDSQMLATDPAGAARTARLQQDIGYLADAFTPGGGTTVSPFPMACWMYWYANCSAGVQSTNPRNQNQWPASETASTTAWKTVAGTALSATASYSTSTANTGWAGALGVYAETVLSNPPVITTATVPVATQSVAYTATLAETGGTSPFTWTLLTGTLPSGITLSTAGVLSGTTTDPAGPYGFTVKVTDAASGTDTASLTLTLLASPVTLPSNPATAPPGFPQLKIEAGFYAAAPVALPGALILDDPVNGKLDTAVLADATAWTDITSFVRSGTITRASTRVQGPLRTYQAGTASVVLKNADGRFDPDNLSGPYVSGGVSLVQPMVPVRARAIWASIEYHLFQGFIDTWQTPDTNYGPYYSETTASAQDGFKVLGGITLPAVPPEGDGEQSGTRITRILNDAGWFTDHRKIGAGDTALQATPYGDTALNLMQLAADTEIGELYMDGSGNVVFRQRNDILSDARSVTPQAVFGDDGVNLPYSAAGRADDDTTLANDIQITRAGGSLQEAQNVTSIARYLFPRSYARSDVLLESDGEAQLYAQWVLYVSLAGMDRFDTLTVTPLRDPRLWPQALGREIGDRVTIIRTPPGMTAITRDVFIRGITHTLDVSAGVWSTTWDLDDATRYTGFLTLDDPNLGKVSSGNKLAY